MPKDQENVDGLSMAVECLSVSRTAAGTHKTEKEPWTENEWKTYKDEHPGTELNPQIKQPHKGKGEMDAPGINPSMFGSAMMDIQDMPDGSPQKKSLNSLLKLSGEYFLSIGGNAGTSYSAAPGKVVSSPGSGSDKVVSDDTEDTVVGTESFLPGISGMSDEEHKKWNDGLKKIGKIGEGHSGAEKWMDADGKEWSVKKYAKDSMGKDHGRVERLTNNLLRALGIPAPESRIVNVDGKDAIANEWIDASSHVTPSSGGDHPDMAKGYAADIWLANYDSIGGVEGYNSIIGTDGHAYRIDNGGSLCFKGTEGLKPSTAWAAPGKESKEYFDVHSLQDPSFQDAAPKVFKNVTDDDISKGISGIVEKMPDSVIKKYVSEAGLSPEIADNIYKGLVRRRDYLMGMNKKYKETGLFGSKKASSLVFFRTLVVASESMMGA